MISHTIRYRYAILLLWAVLALVTNPVWHAIGHNHSDAPTDAAEHVSDTHWAEEDICPFCDAVTHHVAPANAVIAIAPAVFCGELNTFSDRYVDLRLRLSTRLRAPPYLA